MKLWLDDIRTMPEGFDWHCWGSGEAFHWIRTGTVTFISFDHDLGEDSLTGYDVAKEIERLASIGMIPTIEWTVHSANPVGRKNIEMAMQQAEKFWSE
jgi:hypothetical protein